MAGIGPVHGVAIKWSANVRAKERSVVTECIYWIDFFRIHSISLLEHEKRCSSVFSIENQHTYMILKYDLRYILVMVKYESRQTSSVMKRQVAENRLLLSMFNLISSRHFILPIEQFNTSKQYRHSICFFLNGPPFSVW